MNIQAIWHCSRSKRKLKQHYHFATVSGSRDPAVEQKLKQGSYGQSFEELFQLWHPSSLKLLPQLQGLHVFPSEDLAGASVLHVIYL